jgi:VIT1/CCC1 family predicted Fe2+/Mn2+ transporter
MKTNTLESPLEFRLKNWHGEEWHTSKGRIIRDIVYAVDTGLITTIAFLAGVSVSLVVTRDILLAGIAHIASGTIAIFFGAYISTKAQRDFFENQIERERQEIEELPKKETEEIRDIFRDFGFQEKDLEIVVKRITSDKDLWLKFMIQEEIGVVPGATDSPASIGLISAVSFLIGAIPAISPFFFVYSVSKALLIAAIVVVSFLFALGVWKTRITKVHWLRSGIETLLFGGISCGIGFSLGRIIAVLIH